MAWAANAPAGAPGPAVSQRVEATADEGRPAPSADRLTAAVHREFGGRGLSVPLALCVWRNEGGVVGYSVSSTNDHGPWQLHGARWPGDGGLLEVFYSWGYADPYDVDQSTEFTARYVAGDGWWPWVGARYCG